MNWDRLRQESPEVFVSDGGFLAADMAVVDFLKERAMESPKKRCRVCFHAGPEDNQQEMLIVMNKNSYVRPHRHFKKIETLGVIEGECETLLFDETGRLTDRIEMSPPGGGNCFFYRMPDGLFHTLRFCSEWLVFVETTIGPFERSMTELAQWAPPETDPIAGHHYLAGLTTQ